VRAAAAGRGPTPSPQASFIHGTQLFIDGGMNAMVRPTQF